MSPTDRVRRFDAHRFLFAPADAGPVGVLRILLACMLVWAFWSEGLGLSWRGPTVSGLEAAYRSVFLTSWYAWTVLGVSALFGMGIKPRITGLALVVLLLPLAFLTRGRQSRQLLLLALLAFSMLRSDARFSVSALLGRPTPAAAGPMWPLRLMQIQLSIVYGINAIAKATPEYLSGEILIGMAMMRPNFNVVFSDGTMVLGAFAIPIALAAVGSVLIEAWLAIGFWGPRPIRMLTAILGVGFHVLLMWVVAIFMLNFACIFLYLTFLMPLEARRPSSGGASALPEPSARQAGVAS